MQKYSRPLAGRPVTVVFWWGKIHTKVKTARLPFFFFFFCDAVFLVSFLPCRTPPPDHVHEGLPDHFRPCPRRTWAPYYTAARNWLKPKGVSALTDRSGVVYCPNSLRAYDLKFSALHGVACKCCMINQIYYFCVNNDRWWHCVCVTVLRNIQVLRMYANTLVIFT